MRIREAQEYSNKQFNELNIKLKKEWSPLALTLKILEEAGEVASVIAGLEGYKPPHKPKTCEMLGRELSDLMFNIFLLAETYEIDLESVFKKTIDAYPEYLLGKHQEIS